jgi:hypothetical protein
MKKLIINIILIIAIAILLASCKKEPIVYPSEQLVTVPPYNAGSCIQRWGKFLLIDAVMYMDNYDTGEKKVYQHFGVGKTHSSLRWGGSIFAIEDIVKDSTTYSFWKPLKYPGTGRFVLNGDTTKYYLVNYMGMNNSIIEDPLHGQQNLGGSARPYSGQTKSYSDSTIYMEIEEMIEGIQGYNCRYFTLLTLKKTQSW